MKHKKINNTCNKYKLLCNICDFLIKLAPQYKYILKTTQTLCLNSIFKKHKHVLYINELLYSIKYYQKNILNITLNQIPLIITCGHYYLHKKTNKKHIYHTTMIIVYPVYNNNIVTNVNISTVGLQFYKNNNERYVNILSPDNELFWFSNKSTTHSCNKFMINNIEPLTMNHLVNLRNLIKNNIVEIIYKPNPDDNTKTFTEIKTNLIFNTNNNAPIVTNAHNNTFSCDTFVQLIHYNKHIKDYSIKSKHIISQPSTVYSAVRNFDQLVIFINFILNNNKSKALQWLISLYNELNYNSIFLSKTNKSKNITLKIKH